MEKIEMEKYNLGHQMLQQQLKALEKLKYKAVMLREETAQYVKDINSILDLALYFKEEEREEFIKKASQAVLSKQLATLLEAIDE